MVFTKLIVFASLCCVASAACLGNKPTLKPTGKGYLVMDFSILPQCYNMPSNQICSASFNHQVVGACPKLDLVQLNMLQAKLNVGQAKILNGTRLCRKAVLEYSCSNTLMKCKTNKKATFGVNLAFDVARTKKACANVQKLCPAHIQAGTIYNCAVIQDNPMEFAECSKHCTFPGDICPSTNFMYSKAITRFYPFYAKGFREQMKKFGHALNGSSCVKEFTGLYCQILRGAMCSDNRKKRVYAISQQDCVATVNKCIIVPNLKMHLLESCKLLPDATTARKEPLPTVTQNNNVVKCAGKR